MKTVVLTEATHKALMSYKLEHGLRSIDAVISHINKPTAASSEVTKQLCGILPAKAQMIDRILEMEDWL